MERILPKLVRPKKSDISRLTVSDATIRSWYGGKRFTADWTSWNYPVWRDLLEPYRRKAARVLEIGSWEGRSALFFLNYLPRARLCCVDTFAGSEDHHIDPALAAKLSGLEERFDFNLAPFSHRVEKIKSTSVAALSELGIDGQSFDIAYIDGSHRATDVYCDGVLTWPMVVGGGLMMFDDYRWDYLAGTRSNPKAGIDAFLNVFSGQYRVVHDSYQIAIEKHRFAPFRR